MPQKHLFNDITTKEKRRRLRKRQTKEEESLWFFLRDSKIGCKFRRQYSVGQYITDFCCPKKKLVIEIDGAYHLDQKEYDDIRECYLIENGFHVLRFLNNDVEKRIDWVLSEIKNKLRDDVSPLLTKERGGAA